MCQAAWSITMTACSSTGRAAAKRSRNTCMAWVHSLGSTGAKLSPVRLHGREQVGPGVALVAQIGQRPGRQAGLLDRRTVQPEA